MTSLGNEDLIDSKEAAAILGITQNNLRQIVFRKELEVHGRKKKRSLFSRAQVEAKGKRAN